VLYEKYNTNGKLSLSSIAHEILHLYGAWDLNKNFRTKRKQRTKGKKIFPNSIMLKTSYNINELTIDSLSAWLIGWNQNPKDWYETFRPKE
jgi:hypothetical protein